MFEYILIEKLMHILIEQLIYLYQCFYKYISISIYYHNHTTNAIDIVNKKRRPNFGQRYISPYILKIKITV